MSIRIRTIHHAIQRHSLTFLSCLSILFLIVFSGCAETSGTAGDSPTNPSSSKSTLYVTNGNTGKLLSFDLSFLESTLVVDGVNLVPDRQYPDALSGPTGIFLDRINDTLYLANTAQNAIQIYENASTLSAPLAATRVISGALTLLDQPFALTFDAVNDRLFVANKDGNTIIAFCAPSASLTGNIAPCNLLVGENTLIDFPKSLAIDTNKNILYISNTGNDSILVYDNATTIGASPDLCDTHTLDFTACNIAPSRVIAPHTETEHVSKLELPFGVFIDITNDRLYVANTGLNSPGIFIYENASTLDAPVIPGRVITGNIPQLSPSCSTVTSDCTGPQLTLPSGIDVDVSRARIFIVNNNSPNNVNENTGNNVESPSLLVFGDVDTNCTLTMHLCNLKPDRRIGGDVDPDQALAQDVNAANGLTLSSPVGVAFDPRRGVTYVANTGGNNIFVYSVDGNTAPLDVNVGGSTLLNIPSGLFYDEALDRLYIANAGDGTTPSTNPITVYDQVSNKDFDGSNPNWAIKTNTGDSLDLPRGVYIDKTNSLLITLDGSLAQFGLKVYAASSFPISTATGSSGSTTRNFEAPDPTKVTDGLSTGGPTGMSVDEGKEEIYVTDNNNSLVVYDYSNPSAIIKVRTITGLNKPSGVFVDTQRNILYVTNNGEAPSATSDFKANTVFVFDNASARGDGVNSCPTPCPPDRIISTVGLTTGLQNKLKAPIAPFVDMVTDSFFLINSATDQNAVFRYNAASTLGDSSAGCINGSVTCTDTLPAKVLIGATTQLDFSNTNGAFTGAVLLANHLSKDTLYVAQSETGSGSLLAFGLNGKMTPAKIWAGGGGVFSSPEAVAIDPLKNVLYVANQGNDTLSILPSADQVDVVPATTSGKRDLSNIQLNSPAGIFIDPTQDRLYVSNSKSTNCTPPSPCGSILVFNDASGLGENEAPDQTISHAQLDSPQGLAVDTTLNRLYVASKGGSSVLVFSVQGTATINTILSGSQSGLNKPIGIAIDTTRDLLYVLNQGKTEVLVFAGASTLIGGEAPTRTISGSDVDSNNFLVAPSAIFVDAAKDLLYLADRDGNAVHIFSDASTADGPGPHKLKTLSGNNTGIVSPSALTVTP